jgi:hypothetical protein
MMSRFGRRELLGAGFATLVVACSPKSEPTQVIKGRLDTSVSTPIPYPTPPNVSKSPANPTLIKGVDAVEKPAQAIVTAKEILLGNERRVATFQYGAIVNLSGLPIVVKPSHLEALCKSPLAGLNMPENAQALFVISDSEFSNYENDPRIQKLMEEFSTGVVSQFAQEQNKTSGQMGRGATSIPHLLKTRFTPQKGRLPNPNTYAAPLSTEVLTDWGHFMSKQANKIRGKGSVSTLTPEQTAVIAGSGAISVAQVSQQSLDRLLNSSQPTATPNSETKQKIDRKIKPGEYKTVSFGEWVEFEGGIIANQCEWLLLQVNGTNLYDHLNNPTLGLKSPAKDPMALILLPTVTDQQTFQAGEIFRAGELRSILSQTNLRIEEDNMMATPTTKLVEAVRSSFPPGSHISTVYPELGNLLSYQWASSLIAVANESRPESSKFKWDNNKKTTLQSKPVFQILGIL